MGYHCRCTMVVVPAPQYIRCLGGPRHGRVLPESGEEVTVQAVDGTDHTYRLRSEVKVEPGGFRIVAGPFYVWEFLELEEYKVLRSEWTG